MGNRERLAMWTNAAGLTVRRAATEVELLALQEPWTALAADVPGTPIFLTWEWISTWWRHYGEGHRHFVLSAWDGSGRLIGIAPWMATDHRAGPLVVRRLAFAGTGTISPAHMDLLAKPGDEAAVGGAFVGYLDAHRSEWDVLDLASLSCASVLPHCFSLNSGRLAVGRADPCLYIPLTGGWSAIEGDSMVKKLRVKVKRCHRKLEREQSAPIVFRRVSSREEVDTGLKALLTMQRERLSKAGFRSPLDDARFMAFHREMAALALDRDWLRFELLSVAEQTVAVNLCYRHQDVYYDYQMGFCDGWEPYSPGHLLLAHLIDGAISEGMRELDLLHGAEGYKTQWTSCAHLDSHILLSRNFRGELWLRGAATFDGAVTMGRKMLPYSWRQKGNRVLAKLATD